MQRIRNRSLRALIATVCLPAQVWDQVYAQELGPLPPAIHSPCCAEFVVSRDRILAHPRRAASRTTGFGFAAWTTSGFGR